MKYRGDEMANIRPGKNHELMKKKVLYVSARLFLEQGFTATPLKQIAKEAEINIGSLMNLFKTKEDILCELVSYMHERQFAKTIELINGITSDKILFYATESCLQLYIAETGEHVRDLYGAAYSMPNSSAIVQKHMTEKLESIFKESFPELETKDFYELEIATSGIMRAFMTIPCNMYFTMDRKISRFLETTLKIYDIPKEKIKEIDTFVLQFDFEKIAQEMIQHTLENLDSKMM